MCQNIWKNNMYKKNNNVLQKLNGVNQKAK